MPHAGIRRQFLLALIGTLVVTGPAIAQEEAPQRQEVPEYFDSGPPKDISEAGAETVTATIPARNEWTSAGVVVRKGVKYRISASGEWHMGGFCGRSGPSGTGSNSPLCFSFIPPFVLPEFQIGTLIGRIGRDGKPFLVGESLEFEAERDGTLFLRGNDGRGMTWDNSGYVTSKVALANPPPPPAAPPAATPPTAVRQNGVPPATPLPPLSAASTQHWAVVIGVSDYADSRVTLGELIPFLSEHVRRETLNAQSPTVAGRFDPALSLGR